MDELFATGLNKLAEMAIEKVFMSSWTQDVEKGRIISEQLNISDIRSKFTNKYINNVLRMRTLHSSENDVLLHEIYLPLKIGRFDGKNITNIKLVDDGYTINHSRIINLVGIAGQGKSTILRKLFFEEIKAGNRIPLFIELRRVHDGDVKSYIKEQLIDFGVTFDDEQFNLFLQSKKVVIMADGFDEVNPELRTIVLEGLKMLNNRFNCPLISTSRPDTEICRESGIINYKVLQLQKEDIFSILKRLESKEESYRELEGIINSNQSLAETLTTPILVNLLYFCYPYWDSIPENMSDFYDKLFDTLYHRHDKLKNYTRPRKSSVPAAYASFAFSSISFLGLSKGVYEFSKSQLIEYSTFASNFKGFSKNELEPLIQDICSITCLIQQDGYDRYVFLHKSVQEFYAARFLSSLNTKRKEDLYKKLAERYKDSKFDNVLVFLNEINRDDFDRIYIKHLSDILLINKFLESKDDFIKSRFNHVIEDERISFISSDENKLKFTGMISVEHALSLREMVKTINIKHKLTLEPIGIDGRIVSVVDKLTLDEVLKIPGVTCEKYNRENATKDFFEYSVPMKSMIENFGIYDCCIKYYEDVFNSYVEWVFNPAMNTISKEDFAFEDALNDF